jgi:hypothetical protein
VLIVSLRPQKEITNNGFLIEIDFKNILNLFSKRFGLVILMVVSLRLLKEGMI